MTPEERAAWDAKYKALEDSASSLRATVKARETEIERLTKLLETKQSEIESLRSAPSLSVEDMDEKQKDATTLSLDDMNEKQKAAARQKLHRWCQRADVPVDIHLQWKQGGSAREKLLRLFVSTNFDKERAPTQEF